MESKKPKYEFVEHTADLGIKVRGEDLQNLFETAAMAMTHLLVDFEPNQAPSIERICLSANDLEDLMVRWLGEILYLFEGDSKLATGVKITLLQPFRIEAEVETVPFDPKMHEILREIKAVTYHQIEVSKKDDNWEARIIFDI